MGRRSKNISLTKYNIYTPIYIYKYVEITKGLYITYIYIYVDKAKTLLEVKKMEEFKCNNCDGEVVYQKRAGNGWSGWGHVIATGCIKPAVSREDWKRYLELSRKTDVRKDIKQLDDNINTVVSRSDGTLEIFVKKQLESTKRKVITLINEKCLNNHFTKIDFHEVGRVA